VNACLFYEEAKAAFDTLLELGFDPSAQDKNGLTALHFVFLFSGAVGQQKAAHFVKGLLDKGADYNLKDSLGVSAKDQARVEFGFLRIAFEDAGVKFDDDLPGLSRGAQALSDIESEDSSDDEGIQFDDDSPDLSRGAQALSDSESADSSDDEGI